MPDAGEWFDANSDRYSHVSNERACWCGFGILGLHGF
jgi:hypothetical protein